jgi:hypothetical protein
MMPEEPGAADPGEFPVPYMLGGPKPKLPGAKATKASGRGAPTASKGAMEPAPAPNPGLAPGNLPVDPERVDPTPDGTPKAKSGDAANAPAAKKKPVKIDPMILEKFLQRNATRPDGQ